MVTAEILSAEGGIGGDATIQDTHCWHRHKREGTTDVLDCYEIRCPPATHKPPTI